MEPMERIAQALGHDFSEPDLLREALTHRSAGAANNERLEFLGDALLNSIIAIELYRLRPASPEGELSRLRAALVRGETLAGIAREMGLGEALVMGEGERKSGGHRRASILADAFEALVGAMFLDSDFETVRARVLALFASRLTDLPNADELKDPKTRLQEYLQSRRYSPPAYEVIEVTGADHAQQFTVRCRIEALDCERQATARSRRKAEQQAALTCLEALAQHH
ncbi:ribonuclease III [Halofilum ochraceum]|uniref:ribonuclease III n=1 Tax=Halofilum ochraceum TaxID=1611323 RepID=UPI0008D9CE56